ncbi:hypothetical protein [Halostagnicola kamekurae]|nr:hypothetical protein [Halostagnicola kamekurae]
MTERAGILTDGEAETMRVSIRKREAESRDQLDRLTDRMDS